MSIIANNSYRYNYEMEFWLLKDYTAEDLLDNWNEIYEYARKEDSEENAFFLADCLDVLCEKVLILSDQERGQILDKVNHGIELFGLNNRLGAA